MGQHLKMSAVKEVHEWERFQKQRLSVNSQRAHDLTKHKSTLKDSKLVVSPKQNYNLQKYLQ